VVLSGKASGGMRDAVTRTRAPASPRPKYAARFTRRDAGSLVRELWSEGQRPTADEILKELTSAEIELEAVAEYARESLA
jgi:hypothetical protein